MLRSLPEAEENGAIMVAQTTHLLKDYKISKKLLKRYIQKVKIFDTICRVTENRQAEADELSKKSRPDDSCRREKQLEHKSLV